MADVVRVSVVYAEPDRQRTVRLELSNGATVSEAVARSGLAAAREPLNCAIYGRIVQPTTAVRDGDRIEILRPLTLDPKEQRRRAAADAKRSGTKRAS